MFFSIVEERRRVLNENPKGEGSFQHPARIFSVKER